MTQEIIDGITVIRSDYGKVFSSSTSVCIIGHELYLGTGDSPDNYVEIDEPDPEVINIDEFQQ